MFGSERGWFGCRVGLFVFLVSGLMAEILASSGDAAIRDDLGKQISVAVGKMSVEQKVRELLQPDIPKDLNGKIERTGIALFSGNSMPAGKYKVVPNRFPYEVENVDATPQAWQRYSDDFSNRERFTFVGIDAVHGNAKVQGSTIFPHNSALGAANNADLVEQIGHITSIEMASVGHMWAFAPCIAVPQDIRWGRTYEGYSSDPEIVSRLGAALIRGLQHPHPSTGLPMIAACAKHYAADGATSWGSGFMKKKWGTPAGAW